MELSITRKLKVWEHGDRDMESFWAQTVKSYLKNSMYSGGLTNNSDFVKAICLTKHVAEIHESTFDFSELFYLTEDNRDIISENISDEEFSTNPTPDLLFPTLLEILKLYSSVLEEFNDLYLNEFWVVENDSVLGERRKKSEYYLGKNPLLQAYSKEGITNHEILCSTASLVEHMLLYVGKDYSHSWFGWYNTRGQQLIEQMLQVPEIHRIRDIFLSTDDSVFIAMLKKNCSKDYQCFDEDIHTDITDSIESPIILLLDFIQLFFPTDIQFLDCTSCGDAVYYGLGIETKGSMEFYFAADSEDSLLCEECSTCRYCGEGLYHHSVEPWLVKSQDRTCSKCYQCLCGSCGTYYHNDPGSLVFIADHQINDGNHTYYCKDCSSCRTCGVRLVNGDGEIYDYNLWKRRKCDGCLAS